MRATPFLPIVAIALACAQFGRAQNSVPDSAADAKPLAVGANAPDSMVMGLDGKSVSLSHILKHKKTVLIFYRGGWCPYCNAHLSDLATIEDKVAAKGFQIIAISPETPEELNKTMTKDHLNYRLFSDSSADAMKKFGVAYRLDDTTYLKMRDSYGVDIEKSQGQTHHILPVPSVFVIDKDGKIKFVHANPDFKVRLKGDEILKVIDSM
jgi:peroxiredoxin